MSIPGLFGTVELGGEVLWRDYGMMLALTLLLALFAYGLHTRAVITRFEGAILLVAWVGYNLLLSWQS